MDPITGGKEIRPSFQRGRMISVIMKIRNSKLVAGFLIPSLIGILLFMIPIRYNDNWTIVVKILADIIGAALGDYLPLLCVAIVTVSAVRGVTSLKRPSFITTYPIIDKTFSATPVWAIIRVIGAIFIWLTYLKIDAGEDATGIIHMITMQDAGALS